MSPLAFLAAQGWSIAAASEPARAPTSDDLRAEWRRYVHAFVQADGRVIDRAGADVSTSEGQAYALVRATWCDDRATFDRVLRWTVDNLQGSHVETLPGWQWGRRSDGSWGVLDPSPAADADTWMAWALLRAGERWHDRDYIARALLLLDAIWQQETTLVAGRRILLPGPWARGQAPLRVNPSYWLPFAWRRFATADPSHDWAGLVGDAYAFWDTCRSPSGLQPDWCWLDPDTGWPVAPPAGQEGSVASGYEAFRVGWTLAAELRWHGEARTRGHLEAWGRLADTWSRGRPIPAVRDAEGRPREPWGYLGLYGALLPAWALVRPSIATDIYTEELRAVRDATPDPRAARDYYAHNWVWMGLALWNGLATP